MFGGLSGSPDPLRELRRTAGNFPDRSDALINGSKLAVLIRSVEFSGDDSSRVG